MSAHIVIEYATRILSSNNKLHIHEQIVVEFVDVVLILVSLPLLSIHDNHNKTN
jgi:MFS-type transporter involved in bile tolerance (Atg22 family)